MSELIRKWDAIYAVEEVGWYHINERGELVKGANSEDHEPLYKAKDVYDALENVKPVQPELEDKIRAIGYTGKEGRIYIGGRLFAVRELAQ